MTEVSDDGAPLELVEPSVRLVAAFRAMARDWSENDDGRYDDLIGDFAGYVRMLYNQSRGVGLSAGFVPSNTYWLLRDGKDIVGAVRLRHRLSPMLIDEGGHIGYEIAPSARRRGYGTRQLALVLDKARKRGLKVALVTCDADNIGSTRIIEKNGGVYDNEAISQRTGNRVSRYWIEL